MGDLLKSQILELQHTWRQQTHSWSRNISRSTNMCKVSLCCILCKWKVAEFWL